MPLLELDYIYQASLILKGKRKERVYNVFDSFPVEVKETPVVDAFSYRTTSYDSALSDNQDGPEQGYDVMHRYITDGKTVYAPYHNNFYLDTLKNTLIKDDYTNILGRQHVNINGELGHLYESLYPMPDNSGLSEQDRFDDLFSFNKKYYIKYLKDEANLVGDFDVKQHLSDNKAECRQQVLDQVGELVKVEEQGRDFLWGQVKEPTFAIQHISRIMKTGANIHLNLNISDSYRSCTKFPIGMVDAAWEYIRLICEDSPVKGKKPIIDTNNYNALALNRECGLFNYSEQDYKDIIVNHLYINPRDDYCSIYDYLYPENIDKVKEAVATWYESGELEDFELVKGVIIQATIDEKFTDTPSHEVMVMFKNIDYITKALKHQISLEKDNKLSDYVDMDGPQKKGYNLEPPVPAQGTLDF